MKKYIAGVDEVGRGSLIGPVYAAAVILRKNINKKIIKDSKTLTKKKLEKFNILNASMLAMKRAITKLKKKPKLVLIDGNKSPKINNLELKTIIKGDQKIPEISAASIIAKVMRDKLITRLGKKFKGYKWDQNFGYGTKHHLKAIKNLGITKHHRKNFSPINKLSFTQKHNIQTQFKFSTQLASY